MSGGLFDLGMVMATPGALWAFSEAVEDIDHYIARHHRGDRGDLDEHDRQVHEETLKNGLRLLSAYTLKNGTRIWIITEADRSVTTVLLPG